nr:hypothetical protein [Bacteroidota bacterium]
YCTSYKVKMGGEFQYDLYETRSITIAMFDKDNIVVRELYKNQEVLPGPHHLKFNFDATAFEDEYYFVKVIDNGEIVINMKIDMPERRRDG